MLFDVVVLIVHKFFARYMVPSEQTIELENTGKVRIIYM
jgi:hypothetical protein